jgi:hypothetical protein
MSVFQPEIKALLKRFGQGPKSLNGYELEVLCQCRLLEHKPEGHQLTPRAREILGKWD